ncbi:MAG: ATP-binding protein [Bacteroidota bacterium]
MLNQMAFITACTAFASTILAFLSQEVSVVYLAIGIVVTAIYFGIIIINSLERPSWSRFYLSAIVPIWFNIAVLIGGGGFAESIAVAASLAITHVVYSHNQRLKTQIMIVTIVTHVLALCYVGFFTPFRGFVNHAFDEIVVFLISLGWISVLLKMHEHEKDQLIGHLQDKNQQLKETTEQLERFTYIASHDLKSPLRTIVGFLSLMEMDIEKANYSNLKEHMKFAKSGAKQMNYLIQDILELSTLDSSNKKEKNWIDLNEVILKVINNLKEDIEKKNAQILLKKLPAYYCNEVEFLLLFQNLIQNGIKYNKSDRVTIDIWTTQKGDRQFIHFKDNGIGISEEYHHSIFEFFKRLHTNKEYQGTGIGLGLCKKIVLKYGGQIHVASSLGAGTTFNLELPMPGQPIQNARARTDELCSV